MKLLKSKLFRQWLMTPMLIIAIAAMAIYYMHSSYNPQDLEEAKVLCEELCNETQGINFTAQWDDQEYCSAAFSIDGNKDGKIQLEERGRHCWESPLYVECSRSFDDAYGTVFSCDFGHCDNGCPATSCDDVGAQGIVCSELTDEEFCNEIGCTWDTGQCFGVLRNCPKDYDTCKKLETPNGCKWQQPSV